MTRAEIIDTLEFQHDTLTRALEQAYVSGQISKDTRDSIAREVLYNMNTALAILRREEADEKRRLA